MRCCWCRWSRDDEWLPWEKRMLPNWKDNSIYSRCPDQILWVLLTNLSLKIRIFSYRWDSSSLPRWRDNLHTLCSSIEAVWWWRGWTLTAFGEWFLPLEVRGGFCRWGWWVAERTIIDSCGWRCRRRSSSEWICSHLWENLFFFIMCIFSRNPPILHWKPCRRSRALMPLSFRPFLGRRSVHTYHGYTSTIIIFPSSWEFSYALERSFGPLFHS